MNALFEQRSRDRLLDGVAGWLERHLVDFDPPQEDELLDVMPEEIRPDRARKAFGELGAALRLTTRAGALHCRDDIRRIRDKWTSLLTVRRFFFDLPRRIHLFPMRVVACSALASFEALDPALARALQRVLDRQFIDRVELSAWHKLDMKYYLDSLSIRHAYGTNAELLPASTLVALPALPHATTYDFYGLTHLVFHFSDFGRTDIRAALGVHFDNVREYAAAALADRLAARDWDLTAEMLLTRLCLGVRGEPIDREGARALCEAQRPSGLVPGRLHNDDFFDAYHPTLLCLFLIACEESLP